MTAPKQTAKKKADNLVIELDRFAVELMADAQGKPTETRIDIFKEIAKWVAIKNKLEANDEEGTALDGYRSKLSTGAAAGEPDNPRRTANLSHSNPRAAVQNRWGKPDGPDTTNDYGGSALDAIKSRLPRSSAGSAQRDLDGAGGEDDADAGDDRGFHSGADSDA